MGVARSPPVAAFAFARAAVTRFRLAEFETKCRWTLGRSPRERNHAIRAWWHSRDNLIMRERSDLKRAGYEIQQISKDRNRADGDGVAFAAGGASAWIAQADPGGASSLHRLVADFQNNTSVGGNGEIFTTATPLPAGMGGTVTYTRDVKIPDNTVFITFSGQADAHFGSALLMSASVTDSTGAVTVCEPLAGQTGIGGGGTRLTPGWYTLLHLPDAGTTVTNCNDGTGGSADCHDNGIYFSCCAQVTPDKGRGDDEDEDGPSRKGHDPSPTSHTINIRLANSDGATSFYERSTIYIDSARSTSRRPLCTGHASP